MNRNNPRLGNNYYQQRGYMGNPLMTGLSNQRRRKQMSNQKITPNGSGMKMKLKGKSSSNRDYNQSFGRNLNQVFTKERYNSSRSRTNFNPNAFTSNNNHKGDSSFRNDSNGFGYYRSQRGKNKAGVFSRDNQRPSDRNSSFRDMGLHESKQHFGQMGGKMALNLGENRGRDVSPYQNPYQQFERDASSNRDAKYSSQNQFHPTKENEFSNAQEPEEDNFNEDQTVLIRKLEREAAGLREMLKIKKMEKKRILEKKRKIEKERRMFMKNNPDLNLKDEDALTLLENQREELKSLKLNYNLLKEETEKQKQDLKKLTMQEDELMVPPTSKEELLRQNKLLEQKVTSLKRDFDRLLYEKTLKIEKKARAEMQKHAIKCALQFADTSDPEIAQLIEKLKKLEMENSKLEEINEKKTGLFGGGK